MKNKFAQIILALTFLASFVSPSFAAPRTNAVWQANNGGGVEVVPYIAADKRTITFDFQNVPANTAYIYYNLNYTNKKNGIKGGIEGSFIPGSSSYNGSYNGVKFIRKSFIFGMCSRGACVYDWPKDVSLTVNTQLLNSKKQFTQKITFPNDQFSH